MNRIWLYFSIAALINMVIALISLSTAVWIDGKQGASEGLWQICGARGCWSYPPHYLPAYFDIVRVFHVLGFVASLCAVVFSILLTFNKGKFFLVVTSFSLTGLFLIVSMAAFTSYQTLVFNKNYGYSYYLGWTACALGTVLGFVSGLMIEK